MKSRHSSRCRRANPDCAGGILVTVLLVIAVMSMLAAATIYRVSSRHAASYQSVAWNEAMSSAEAGADLALLAMNNSISSPSTAWTGWTPSDATTFPKTYTPSIPSHSGEGNTKVFAKVVVDNNVASGWMRVRSTGVAELSSRISNGLGSGLEGAVRSTAGTKNHRAVLRKPRFFTDITGGALHLPQITRTIEVMAVQAKTSPYMRGLTMKNTVTMSGSSAIDSFDSSKPAYSTNGQYDPAKRLQHGDVASNSSGNLSDLKNSWVYGNASSNGGTIQNTGHVQGTVTNNFQATIPDIAKPVWTTIQSTPTTINNPSGPVTLTGGPAGSPVNYKLSTLTISNQSKALILDTHAAGEESYINIWVTGKTTISGSGYIEQMPGVHVTIYNEDDVTISGNGYLNDSNTASYLEIFGVTPSSGTQKLTVSGNGTFIGLLNAPAFDTTISGSGAFIGAAIVRSVVISGSGDFHYDEALNSHSGTGIPAGYYYASWAEDIR
jgi:Tfp pilus assembly protein PilX